MKNHLYIEEAYGTNDIIFAYSYYKFRLIFGSNLSFTYKIL